MSTALAKIIQKTYQNQSLYYSIFRELAWCSSLSVAMISKDSKIQKICFFETKDVIEHYPNWHTGSTVPVFVQNILGYQFFSNLLAQNSYSSVIAIEIYTESQKIGFQSIPFTIIEELVHSIRLESALLSWHNKASADSEGVFHTLRQHSSIPLSLVPIRMYDLGETDNIMPILLKVPKFMEDGIVACIAFTAQDRRLQAQTKLEQNIRLGYSISQLSLSGTEFIQQFNIQTQLHQVCDGILWNPFTPAEFFLPWSEFFSWHS
tara:strand:+ start:109 stop:897 length:789 start_codon:yes stop_codon:yes gene_type:complete